MCSRRAAAPGRSSSPEKALSGWTNVAGGTALAQSGVCVAAAPDGSVGFAYVNAAGSLCFNSDGNTLGSVQVVSSAASCLTPCSLAYDSAGSPAIVYSLASSGATANQLYLARRNSQGVWSDELLPVSGQQASLAFDALGEPLIAASTSGGITLLGIERRRALERRRRGQQLVHGRQLVGRGPRQRHAAEVRRRTARSCFPTTTSTAKPSAAFVLPAMPPPTSLGEGNHDQRLHGQPEQ